MNQRKWLAAIIISMIVAILINGCATDKQPINEEPKPSAEKNVQEMENRDKDEKESLADKNNQLQDETDMKDTTKLEIQAPAEGYDVPILMYHAIDEFTGKGIKELYVTPENFKQQMEYIRDAGFTPITFDNLPDLAGIKKPILVTLDDGYKNNWYAYQILKDLNSDTFQAKATIFMIGKKINTKSGLSEQELKEMSDSGIISIQSHTETHPELPGITNYSQELGDIKTKLEAITGKQITALAYPSGRYDAEVIEQTKKYYDFAVTTNPGVANTNESPYEMKRVRINYSTSLESFTNLVGR